MQATADENDAFDLAAKEILPLARGVFMQHRRFGPKHNSYRIARANRLRQHAVEHPKLALHQAQAPIGNVTFYVASQNIRVANELSDEIVLGMQINLPRRSD